MKLEDVGKIYPKGRMLLREAAAVATDEDGVEYVCCTLMSSRAPVVTCTKTGKVFVLSWAEIISLAMARGINEE